MTHYAQFYGNDKPVAMLKDLVQEVMGGSANYIPMQKESDGAIMAGIASGIGGTVLALMSLLNTAANNEIIRQQNQTAQSIMRLCIKSMRITVPVPVSIGKKLMNWLPNWLAICPVQKYSNT